MSVHVKMSLTHNIVALINKQVEKNYQFISFAITSTILNFNGFMKNTNSCTALMSALDNADCHGLILNWTLVIFLIADEQVTTCPGPGSRRNVQPIAYLLWNRVSWHQRSSQQSVATGVQAELMGIPSHASWDIFISASSHPGRPKNELFWNVYSRDYLCEVIHRNYCIRDAILCWKIIVQVNVVYR